MSSNCIGLITLDLIYKASLLEMLQSMDNVKIKFDLPSPSAQVASTKLPRIYRAGTHCPHAR